MTNILMNEQYVNKQTIKLGPVNLPPVPLILPFCKPKTHFFM